MSRSEINLIRDQVPSRRRRFAYYWLIFFYIGIAGVALVYASTLSVQRFIDASQVRRERNLLKQALRAETGSDLDARAYAMTMQARLQSTEESIRTIDTLLRDRANMPRILLGLFVPLPAGFEIDNISIRNANRSLEFTLRVPVYHPESDQVIVKLTQDWKASPGLLAEVDTLQTVSRRQESNETDAYFQHRIKALLRGGNDGKGE